MILITAMAAMASTPGLAAGTGGLAPDPMALAGSGGQRQAAIDPSQLCRAAIAATERTTGIPDEFLSAIGRVESGREAGGTRNPWPWTVNAAGEGHFYASKQAAIDAVRQFQAAGVKSVDVGCLQVNLQFHPDAFQDLERAFDPADNAAYAGRLLLDLFRATGSWPRAASAYHSMTPGLGSAYLQRVLEEWALPDGARPVGGAGRQRQDATMEPLLASPNPSHLVAAGAPAADMTGGNTVAPPPSFGFSRRFMLPQGPQQGRIAAGRTLAAYRAAPVRLTIGPIVRTP